MIINQFITKKTGLTVIIEENRNGSYTAYEVCTQGQSGNVRILTSWSLDWLIDTLKMTYINEELIKEF